LQLIFFFPERKNQVKKNEVYQSTPETVTVGLTPFPKLVPRTTTSVPPVAGPFFYQLF